MARPLAQGHQQQRMLIRDRAAQAFATLGYASASMADLAQACAVSKAALYHYFDSKETILFEALEAYTARLQALVRDTLVDDVSRLSPDEARTSLRMLVTALLHEYADSHSYHVCLLNEVKYLGEQQRTLIRAQQREVVDRITALIAAAFPGRVDATQRSATTMALLGMLNFSFAWWDPEGPLDADGLADLVIDLWFRGLTGSRQAGSEQTGIQQTG